MFRGGDDATLQRVLVPLAFAIGLLAAPEAVEWSSPPGCPDAEGLTRGIERRLGRPLQPDEAAVLGSIELDPRRGYRLSLRVSVGDTSESRELFADDCGALTDAAALVVALAVDPIAVSDAVLEPKPAEPPPPSSVPLPSSRPPEPSTAEPSPGAARPGLAPAAAGRLELLFRVDGGAEIGALVGPTGTVALAMVLGWPRVRLEATGRFVVPRRAARAGVDLEVLLGVAGLRGCARPRARAVEVPLCGGLEAGAMRGSATGASNPQPSQRPWFAATFGAGPSWWFAPRWALWAAVEGVVTIVRPRFVLRDPGPAVDLFSPSVVSGRLSLGLEVRAF